MAANAFYLGIRRSDGNNVEAVQSTSSTNLGPAAGSAADIELRIMTDPGTGPNGLLRSDVIYMMKVLESFVEQGGLNSAGSNLPSM